MRLLVDSHIVVWWLDNPARLSPAARAAIADPRNQVFVSAASIWELGLKIAKGKLRLPAGFVDVLKADGFEELNITCAHASTSLGLPPHHGDPFDRMLIAQALAEGMMLVSRDAEIARYDAPLLVA